MAFLFLKYYFLHNLISLFANFVSQIFIIWDGEAKWVFNEWSLNNGTAQV
jgi:hypothetical protein